MNKEQLIQYYKDNIPSLINFRSKPLPLTDTAEQLDALQEIEEELYGDEIFRAKELQSIERLFLIHDCEANRAVFFGVPENHESVLFHKRLAANFLALHDNREAIARQIPQDYKYRKEVLARWDNIGHYYSE